MKPTIRVEGGDKLRKAMSRLKKGTQRKVVQPILAERLEPMAETMRARARRRTGQMADSVTVSTRLSPAQRAKNRRESPIEVYAGPGSLPQAIQEEFGNFREAPHPFVTPAYEQHKRQALDGVGDDIFDAIVAALKD